MNAARPALGLLTIGLVALAACSATQPERPASRAAESEEAAVALPPDPPPVDEWHREPVISRAASRNVIVLNHADPIIRADHVAGLAQRQYDFLAELVGRAPRWIFLHIGSRYPSGFSTRVGEFPEMFLQANGIFDTENNYAHEMAHCFNGAFGRFPHWFEESLADVAYVESEIDLYARREEKPFVATFDRADERSYELLALRARFGRDYYRRVYRVLGRRIDECRRLMESEDLEERNLFLLSVLSEAAGEDLAPHFEKEFGFRPRTRERQRGY